MARLEWMSRMRRTFIAIMPGEAMRNILEAVISRGRAAAPDLRWVPSAHVHITLAFLGSLDDAQVEAACMAAVSVASTVAPFTLRLGQAGSFGRAGAPRTVWIAPDGDTVRLTTLHARLSVALRAANLGADSDHFSPHLTVARVPSVMSPDVLHQVLAALTQPPGMPPATTHVRSIHVLESTQTPGGTRYGVLRTCPLGA